MKKITEKDCIHLLKKKFPKFIPYWNSYVNKWGLDQGITIQMMPFDEYVVDVIKSKNDSEIKEIFDFVEFLYCNGDDSVQDAITTSFLEALLNKDPEEIQFIDFAKHLGKNSIEYCRAWDEFTSVKTKAIWSEFLGPLQWIPMVTK